MRILAHATQQRLPFSECLLLIPLALEGHTGARPHGCRKVTIAGERENALRQRFTVTRSDRRNRSPRGFVRSRHVRRQ